MSADDDRAAVSRAEQLGEVGVLLRRRLGGGRSAAMPGSLYRGRPRGGEQAAASSRLPDRQIGTDVRIRGRPEHQHIGASAAQLLHQAG